MSMWSGKGRLACIRTTEASMAVMLSMLNREGLSSILSASSPSQPPPASIPPMLFVPGPHILCLQRPGTEDWDEEDVVEHRFNLLLDAVETRNAFCG